MKTNDKVTESTKVEIPLNEQIAIALAEGNYVLLAELAKKANNQKKLAAIAAKEAAAEAAKKEEAAKVAKVKDELIDQLTNGEFETFASLWLIIKTTVPQSVSGKSTNVGTGKSNGTKPDGRITKTALTAEMTANGCTLEDLTAKFIEVYPEDTNPEGHARMYLASYAKKNSVDGLYYAK